MRKRDSYLLQLLIWQSAAAEEGAHSFRVELAQRERVEVFPPGAVSHLLWLGQVFQLDGGRVVRPSIVKGRQLRRVELLGEQLGSPFV